jgi:peptidoglycan/LPS O-acetylase OafA/YrhL
MDLRDVNVVEEVPLLVAEEPNLEPMTISDYDKKVPTINRYSQRFRIPQWSLSNFQFQPRWHHDHTKQAYDLALRFLVFFVPSFLRRNPAGDKKLHETAYLDGLRGYACYAVFFAHYFTAYCFEVWHPFGEGANLHFVQTNYFFQLPIFRTFFNGQAAITVFFVLSGYVLSYKPLKLIYAHDYEKLQRCLASSIFRRWWRMFLPVAALWTINLFLVEFGAFSWFDAFRVDNPDMPPGFVETYLTRGDSFWGTASIVWASFSEYIRYTLFKWTNVGFLPEVDGHVWTLQIEFRSSCILFLSLHGTSTMHPNIRLGSFLLSAAACLYWDEWSIATFLMGSAIADLDLRMRRREGRKSRINEVSDFDSLPVACSLEKMPFLQNWFWSHLDQILWGALFITSLFFLSYPNSGADHLFFYSFLWYIHPTTAWDLFLWLSIGGIMLVFVAGRLRSLKSILEWRFSQYIGKTSFALYLVHGTVIKSLGHFVVIQTWKHITGYQGWGYAAGIVLPLLVVVGPVTIVASDCFWRAIDQPSIRFGKWLENLFRDRSI